MRDILFRGKRVSGNKEWIFGNANYYPNLNRWFIRLYPVMNALQTLEDEVAANTVGQYTGLDDKNGRKIFEGDIVALNVNGYNTICTVSWAETVAQFQLWQVRTAPKTATALNLGNYDCEVIGNIHDNPELLKGERK